MNKSRCNIEYSSKNSHLLKFCLSRTSITFVKSFWKLILWYCSALWKIQNDLATKHWVMGEPDFTRLECKICFGGKSCVATYSCLYLDWGIVQSQFVIVLHMARFVSPSTLYPSKPMHRNRTEACYSTTVKHTHQSLITIYTVFDEAPDFSRDARDCKW